MSSNIKQIYDANPVTTLDGTELIYLGQSPYDTGDDAAITTLDLGSNLQANILPGGGHVVGDFVSVSGGTGNTIADSGVFPSSLLNTYVADSVVPVVFGGSAPNTGNLVSFNDQYGNVTDSGLNLGATASAGTGTNSAGNITHCNAPHVLTITIASTTYYIPLFTSNS